MCGIIGYIGNRKTSEVLLSGLKSLEYRGYDSAGVCLCNQKKKEIIKSVGRVNSLEEKIKKESKIKAEYGIAHTRWATNGCANLVNSHPHFVGKVTLVHNGIIENAYILRKKLEDDGYSFQSETDSEIVAALLDEEIKKKKDVLKAIDATTPQLKGSYALVILIEGEKKLYALRKDSPLIIGIGEKENFAASDITAISQYTNHYLFLEEGEIGVIDENEVKVFLSGKIVEKKIQENVSASNDISKAGYDHYMMKEIMEEPVVLERLLKKCLQDKTLLDVKQYEEISIVGCGSAMYAGMIGKNFLEEYANIKTEVIPASEYRYQKKIYHSLEKSLVILISQSGETADTIAALREANMLGIDTLGIVNNPTSTIARESKKVILTNGGVEIAVATTKAYILQVAVLSMIAIQTGIVKKLVSEDAISEYEKVIPLLKEVLQNKNLIEQVASHVDSISQCFFIGRGIDYAISMEGSLKLKEVSYIHSEAYQAGELKHGTISLIEDGTVVFTVISDENLKEKTISNLKETEARGALGVIITTDSLNVEDDYLKIVVPTSARYIQPILMVSALQLLAYYIARNRGCDIDKPRNLAKSVTVE